MAGMLSRGRYISRLPRALAAVALALVVLVSAALGGLPYIWCVPMAQAQLTCCCHHPVTPAHADAAHGTAVVDAGCCEGRRIGSLPVVNLALRADATVPPGPLATWLPVVLALCSQASSVEMYPPRRLLQPRAGPAPPLFELYRSYLI